MAFPDPFEPEEQQPRWAMHLEAVALGALILFAAVKEIAALIG